MSDEDGASSDGPAFTPEEDPLRTITPQRPPNDPRIKELLGRALINPDTLSPPEVQEMAASLVYHLLSQTRT